MSKPRAREDAARMSSVSFANLDIWAAGFGGLGEAKTAWSTALRRERTLSSAVVIQSMLVIEESAREAQPSATSWRAESEIEDSRRGSEAGYLANASKTWS